MRHPLRILPAALLAALATAAFAQVPAVRGSAGGTAATSGGTTSTNGNSLGVSVQNVQGGSGSSAATTAPTTPTTTDRTGAGFLPNGSTVSGVQATVQQPTGSNVSAGTGGNPLANNPAHFAIRPDGTVVINYSNATLTPENFPRDANGNFVPQGAELGRSPGQTSTGTAAGNSSQGLNAPRGTLGVAGVNGAGDGASGSSVVQGNVFPNTLAPGVVVGGVATWGTDMTGQGDLGSGARASSTAAGTSRATNVATTPIYDMATRSAAAREANRRARGDTPRIIGIAPRTENDRTDQIPDDRIIRY